MNAQEQGEIGVMALGLWVTMLQTACKSEDNWPIPGAAQMPAELCLMKMGTLIGLIAGVLEQARFFSMRSWFCTES